MAERWPALRTFLDTPWRARLVDDFEFAISKKRLCIRCRNRKLTLYTETQDASIAPSCILCCILYAAML